MTKEHISKGYKYQECFKKEYMPIFAYQVEDVEITKVICLEYGKNTVGIYYRIKNGEKNAKLTLAPILNIRNHHSISINKKFKVEQKINKNKIEVVIDDKTKKTIFMNVKDANYIKHENNTFNNMFYLEEEKRGFTAEENHVVPGVFEIEIAPNEEKEVSFIC